MRQQKRITWIAVIALIVLLLPTTSFAGASRQQTASEKAAEDHFKRGNALFGKQDIDGAADVNARTKDDNTAFLAAAVNGHLPVVERLLAAGADVNARNASGATALWGATAKGHLQVVERLLAAGADPNVQVQGFTPLKAAKANGYNDIVEALKKAGAK